MGILPLTAILVASEAFVASKRPRRSRPTSKLNSVTSITYVPMLLWPVKALLRWLQRTTDNGRGQLWSIDLRASPQVTTQTADDGKSPKVPVPIGSFGKQRVIFGSGHFGKERETEKEARRVLIGILREGILICTSVRNNSSSIVYFIYYTF